MTMYTSDFSQYAAMCDHPTWTCDGLGPVRSQYHRNWMVDDDRNEGWTSRARPIYLQPRRRSTSRA